MGGPCLDFADKIWKFADKKWKYTDKKWKYADKKGKYTAEDQINAEKVASFAQNLPTVVSAGEARGPPGPPGPPLCTPLGGPYTPDLPYA